MLLYFCLEEFAKTKSVFASQSIWKALLAALLSQKLQSLKFVPFLMVLVHLIQHDKMIIKGLGPSQTSRARSPLGIASFCGEGNRDGTSFTQIGTANAMPLYKTSALHAPAKCSQGQRGSA